MGEYKEPLHPKTNEPLSDLERTLLRLNFAWTETATLLRGFQGVAALGQANPFSRDLIFALDNSAVMVVAKFLEILSSMKTAAKLPRMIEVRRAIAPITRRLDIWPDLRTLRSQALAHAYLTDDGQFIHPSVILARNEAPNHIAEIWLLLLLTRYAISALIEAFFDESWEVLSLVTVEPPPVSPKGITDPTQLNAEFARVTGDAIPLMRAVGIDPDGRVFRQDARMVRADAITPANPEWHARRAAQKASGREVPKPAK